MTDTIDSRWAGGRSAAEQEKFIRDETQRRADSALAEAQRRADELHNESWRRIRADHEEVNRRIAAEDAEDDRRAQAREDFRNAKHQSPSEPKPEPKTEPKPAPDTPKSSPKAAPDAAAAAGDGKRAWSAGRIGTQLGVPPSAVRKLRAGEPVAGIKGLARAQWNAGQHWSGKAGEKLSAKLADSGLAGLGKAGIKGAARLLPGVGALVAGYAAYQDAKQGDYVGAVLNGLGVIPGPVGWIALGAGTIWDLTGWGHHRIDEWAQPDGTNTYILPAAAKDVANVKDLDAGLRDAQSNVFSYQDGPTGTVWSSSPPAAIRLDDKVEPVKSRIGVATTGSEYLTAAFSKVTGTSKSDADGSIQQLVSSYLGGISDLFQQIDKALTDANEQYFTEQRSALTPHLTAMAALKTQIPALMAQLGAASDGAGVMYKSIIDTNAAARQQLSDSGSLTDQGPATAMVTQLQQGKSTIATANDKLAKLFAGTPPAVVAARTGTPTGTAKPTPTPTPATPAAVRPVTPAAVTPTTPATPVTPAKTDTPTRTNDDLSKLLSQLGKQNTTPVSNPMSGLGSGLGGGSPLGSSGLGSGTGGGTPLSQSKPDTSSQSKPKKLVDTTPERKTEPRKLDDKSLAAPKPEQAKAAVPTPEAKPAAAAAPAPVAAQAPAATPPVPQGKQAPAPAVQEPSKEVDVKGQKTTFPDAKTAKLADILSKADPTHPVSLADAAKAAGLTPPVPGQDPGKQVSPADAKPGDVMVAGNKNYMLLGDGKFYDLTDYKVVGAGEIPQNMGDRAGYFHLTDPNPAAAPGQPSLGGVPGPQGPVSPQSTTGPQFPVPNATGAPQGPIDPHAAGPAAPAAPAGVPSVGTPGAPKPAAPGAGPTNAASTNTGTGVGGVSTGGQALDPSAVR
ncbi:hypothetical protein [Mycobacterium sp. 155]|uniref:hypothetical protein n=1 Tax=Mycobacterium sp. 155 TaxID=1157943 RepID=UPI0003A85B72|nr:hypothetical protein [Mycobacterium sp. 155]